MGGMWVKSLSLRRGWLSHSQWRCHPTELKPPPHIHMSQNWQPHPNTYTFTCYISTPRQAEITHTIADPMQRRGREGGLKWTSPQPVSWPIVRRNKTCLLRCFVVGWGQHLLLCSYFGCRAGVTGDGVQSASQRIPFLFISSCVSVG